MEAEAVELEAVAEAVVELEEVEAVVELEEVEVEVELEEVVVAEDPSRLREDQVRPTADINRVRAPVLR